MDIQLYFVNGVLTAPVTISSIGGTTITAALTFTLSPLHDDAHFATAAVKLAERKGTALDQLSLDELQEIDARITDAVYPALSVEASVASRASHGGTAPSQVEQRVAQARAALGME